MQDQLKGVPQIAASRGAFAAILSDGSVVTWGEPNFGGESGAVQDQLKGVQQIAASRGAFAAILSDGSVVTWGEPNFGGESGAVQDQLKRVQPIAASRGAFAAILSDGSVVTWGSRIDCDLGRTKIWWRQWCCARSAEMCGAHPSFLGSFCSYPV